MDGLFVFESAKSRGLRGNVGAWVVWVKFLPGLRELLGSKYFLRGSTFYVGHNFYVGCVGQSLLRGLHGSNIIFAWVFAWVQNFRVVQFFFAWVSFYLLDEILLYYN